MAKKVKTSTISKTEMLDAVESRCLKESIPRFEVGDTVDVHCSVGEGDKERIQIFTGTVIARRGRGINENFTVRRIVAGEGVDIKPVRSGKTRRAKLYYLRKRTGKAIRLTHRHSDHTISK